MRTLATAVRQATIRLDIGAIHGKPLRGKRSKKRVTKCVSNGN